MTKSWHAPLNKVTVLSKVTAALVFITLPFVGYLLGTTMGGESDTGSLVVATVPVVEVRENQDTITPNINDLAVSVGPFTNVLSLQAAISLSENVGGEAWLPTIVQQYKDGYVRFQNPGYYVPYLSDYVMKQHSVYYSPIDSKQGVVDEPRAISAYAQAFEDLGHGLAYDGQALFLAGEVVASTTYADRLSGLGHYVTADSLYFFDETLSTTAPQYNLVKVFDEVNGTMLTAVPELRSGEYTLTTDGWPMWYSDNVYFYCLSTKDQSRRLKMPVTVEFVSSEVDLGEGLWFKAGNSEETGDFHFTEVSTGKAYKTFCDEVKN